MCDGDEYHGHIILNSLSSTAWIITFYANIKTNVTFLMFWNIILQTKFSK